MRTTILRAAAGLLVLLFAAGCGSADIDYQLGIKKEQLEVSYVYSSNQTPKEWVAAAVQAYNQVLAKLKKEPKYAQVKKVNLVLYLDQGGNPRPMAQFVIWLKHPRPDTPNLLANLQKLPSDYQRLRAAGVYLDRDIRRYLLSKL